MKRQTLRQLLEHFKTGDLNAEDLIRKLEVLPVLETGFAHVDLDRESRCGFPEVIFCEGKQPGHISTIAGHILEKSGRLLATRADRAAFEAIRRIDSSASYCELGRTVTVEREPAEKEGLIALVSAGTSDMPVAEEARCTASILGSRVQTFYDIGVAGIHRLFTHIEEIRKANVIVVVAGMEGALASVIGGVSSVPVIAVPTSVGYGASFGGLAALLTMLNSCAAGVSVVNIDNGFGGAYSASLINRAVARLQRQA